MNPSINALKASDGSGNASVATVSNTRAPLATTIQVDTVQGINDDFFGTMGTPHTFTDPVTGETITVISEATAVDFRGHVDGSNLEIDEIAPGYTDAGSSVGDIVIIRPTTQWGDQVAEVLEVSHNDDGTIKNDSISSQQMFTDPLDPVLRGDETITDFAASGGVVAQSAGLVGTFSNLVYYINGLRLTANSVANKTYLASKDTYVDIGIDGVVDYNDVANGAASPALAADHIRLAKVVTNGSAITSVTQKGQDSLGNLIYNRNPHLSSQLFWAEGQDQGNAVRSNTQVFTMTVIPNISGDMQINYRNDFGFAGSNNNTQFRIKVNGAVTHGYTNSIFSNSALWNNFSYMSRVQGVVAGTTYVITVEATNAVGCYIQQQQMAVAVART